MEAEEEWQGCSQSRCSQRSDTRIEVMLWSSICLTSRKSIVGMRTFFWTYSCCQAYALPIGFGAHGPERHLDTFLVIPPEMTVKFVDRLGHGDAFP